MSDAGNGIGKGLISSALLVAAVALILFAGMFLRHRDPEGIRRAAAAAPSPAPLLPLGSTITPDVPTEAVPDTAPTGSTEVSLPVEAARPIAPQPARPLDPLVVKLAGRAEADCGRLAKARGRWTAQLMVACKPETVDRLLDAASGSTKVYVLPASLNDDPCFRVCFGDYATSKEAAAAADLPTSLRGKERIGAVEIAKVLP
jgi:septal ring-binding cell division protein DamX